MSGRNVSSTYRQVIDDVVSNCRADFDEMGIEQAVLDALQASWEAKLVLTRVADFTSDPRMGPLQRCLGPAPTRPAEVDTKPSPPVPSASTASAAGEEANGKKKKKQKGETRPLADDDEINSDLDDSEDEQDAADVEDMDAGGGDLVIALYDKVQRVKNKWKITLKDGVVSVKGKDYLFHKCNGDFEW